MTAKAPRAIAWWWVLPITIVWFVTPIVLELFLPHPTAVDQTSDGAFFLTAYGVLWGRIAPMLLSLIVPVVLISALRWWRRVNRDSVPTARWVIAVPLLLAGASLIFTDYGAYAERGPAYALLTAVAVLLVATSEELMFRGIAVEALRDGLREGWVAVISTLLFAVTHVATAATSWPLIVSAAMGGYLYYLTRRSTGYIIFPILVHAAYDWFAFSLWDDSDPAFYFFLYEAAIFVVVVALTRLVPPAHVRARKVSRASGDVSA
jgi:membrane protease YdiL (CAAX protease family)